MFYLRLVISVFLTVVFFHSTGLAAKVDEGGRKELSHFENLRYLIQKFEGFYCEFHDCVYTGIEEYSTFRMLYKEDEYKAKNQKTLKKIFELYYDGSGHGCEIITMVPVSLERKGDIPRTYLMAVGDGVGDCDGGNYYGLVFDLAQLKAFKEQGVRVENVVVSEVSDGWLYKPKNNIDNYMNTFTCSAPTHTCRDEWWSWF